jgi:Tfp pilus assembly protein PilW
MKNNKGFTLLELIIAVGIASFVVLSVFSLLSSTQKEYSKSKDYLNMDKIARLSLERISRELRNAQSVGLCDSDSIRFSFMNPTRTLENVTYSIEKRGTTKQIRTLLRNGVSYVPPLFTVITKSATGVPDTTAPVFTYYDSNNQPTTDTLEVSYVSIQLQLYNVEKQSVGNMHSYKYRTLVKLRNKLD